MPSKVELATTESLELPEDVPASEPGSERRSTDEESDTPGLSSEPGDVEDEA
jgi:hypothetical protein